MNIESKTQRTHRHAATALFCALVGVAGGMHGACSTSARGSTATSQTSRGLLVTTSNFTTAEAFAWDAESRSIIGSSSLDDQDTIAAEALGQVMLLQRTLGLLSLRTPDAPLQESAQISLRATEQGASINPVQVLDDPARAQAFVIGQQSNEIRVLAQRDGRVQQVDAIDLQGFVAPDDTDGNVEASQALFVSEDRFVVALGRYQIDDSFTPQFSGGAVLVVIDASTRRVVDIDPDTPGDQGIALQAENPAGGMVWDPESARLWVTMRGLWGSLDGGIEVVDVEAGRSEGLRLREEDFGEEVFAIAQIPSDRAHVTLQLGSLASNTRVVRCDLRTLCDDMQDEAREVLVPVSNGFAALAVVGPWLAVTGIPGEAGPDGVSADPDGMRLFHAQVAGDGAGSEAPPDRDSSEALVVVSHASVYRFGDKPVYGVASLPASLR